MEPYSFADLRGKVCVITGGAGIIGTALAEGLARNGIKVAIADFDEKKSKDVAQGLSEKTGGTVIGVFTNVLDKSALTAAKETIQKELGPIDILINGAGGNAPTATTEEEFLSPENRDELEKGFFGLDIEGFRKVYDLNFLGTVLPTMVFSEEMVRRGGSIVNISSMNSYRPLTKIPAYSAAKASINNLTEWLAVHFAKTGIRVNAIAPGFFLTDQNRFLLLDKESGTYTPRAERIIYNTPMGRFGEPEELTGTVLYLVSDLAKFVTGVVIPIDGGFNAFSGV